jgi:Flp pilus assembly protein TadG
MTRRQGRLNRKGQALVEFALVLPLVLLLVVGMLEFAKAWNVHQVITDALREGARRAVLADGWPLDSAYAPMWRYLAQSGYDPTYATMEVCDPPPLTACGGASANFKKSGFNVTVKLSLPYRIWVLGNKPILMTSTYTVRNE